MALPKPACVVVLAFILSAAMTTAGYASSGDEVDSGSGRAPMDAGKDRPEALKPALSRHNSFFAWRTTGDPVTFKWARAEPEAPAVTGAEPKQALSWETGQGKSRLIPALEIPGFLVLLNAFDRVALQDKRTEEGKSTYGTNPSTFWHQLTHQDWTFDQDTFRVNQFGHPYEGATMYAFPRSAGLGFWESLIYSNVGSFLWEMGGENSRPSINDLITTGNAGSLLGEALFRMAELVLEDGGSGPSLGHRLAAAAISPPTAFNRAAFGKRFDTVFPSHKPATLWMCRAGASVDTHSSTLPRRVEEPSHNGIGIVEFSMHYGLPGKPGYTYRRPMDYFNFEVSTRTTSHNLVDTLTIYGLLKGVPYEGGEDYRGIWGLYGSYDYISPYLFRVSSTALSLGTTGQYWLAPGVALQGSVLGGIGFGATGLETDVVEERGYHYGATPQWLVAIKALFGARAMLELTARGYYVSDIGPDHDGGEMVIRGRTGFTVRIHDRHAVGVQYSESIRETNYDKLPSKIRSEGTISLVYSFVSDRWFGAVDWRSLKDE